MSSAVFDDDVISFFFRTENTYFTLFRSSPHRKAKKKEKQEKQKQKPEWALLDISVHQVDACKWYNNDNDDNLIIETN